MALTTAAFEWVRSVVEAEAAIVLEPGKEYLVESRLSPLARAAGNSDVSGFIDDIKASADRRHRERVVDALTTNETLWFRDSKPFTALEKEILPALAVTRANSRKLRIWSAACSTGQEPYSIAMTIHDNPTYANWSTEIVATDISVTVLEQARQGSYSQLEINRGLPSQKLVRHFRQAGMRWQVNDYLQQMLTFRQLNLATQLPVTLGQFDVVFLRNVLIYFSPETRVAILRRIRQTCRPDAYLVLGGSEIANDVRDDWARYDGQFCTYYRPR